MNLILFYKRLFLCTFYDSYLNEFYYFSDLSRLIMTIDDFPGGVTRLSVVVSPSALQEPWDLNSLGPLYFYLKTKLNFLVN